MDGDTYDWLLMNSSQVSVKGPTGVLMFCPQANIFLMIKIFRFPELFLMTAGIRKGGTGWGYPESPQWYGGGRRRHMVVQNA